MHEPTAGGDAAGHSADGAALQVLTPAIRYRWPAGAHMTLVGQRVRVDTPADATDQAHGLSVLSDTGTVATVEVDPVGRVRRFVLQDGFVVPIEVDSTVLVCRRPGCLHDEDPACPLHQNT